METIKAEREAIESELTSATADMKSKFLNALAQYEAISEQAMSVENLGMVYGPLQCQVRKQEAFVADVKVSCRSTAITILHFTNYNFSVLNLGIFKVLIALLLKIFDSWGYVHCVMNGPHFRGS